ncbi:hypothetical protein ABE41_016890 [Fictibacillus arsenicus]|uniref:Uncharacterized protein n=1 Tax=Fictibacillus arsenicus TaxID=255247 RepID=A0A1B1Z899_9BACL|nr:hypothetical protein [Fictibacillus arsenicus]ANX13687.1 hypothetical protein ABE41_016890 [Fictibacillus arsenicus]
MHELTNSRYLTEAKIENMETTNFEEVAEGEDLTELNGYLPRYRAQYKIQFNKDHLHDLAGGE